MFCILAKGNKNSSEHPGKVNFGGNEQKKIMAEIRILSDTQQQIAYTEHDCKPLLPLREMAMSLGLIDEKPKSIRTNRCKASCRLRN